MLSIVSAGHFFYADFGAIVRPNASLIYKANVTRPNEQHCLMFYYFMVGYVGTLQASQRRVYMCLYVHVRSVIENAFQHVRITCCTRIAWITCCISTRRFCNVLYLHHSTLCVMWESTGMFAGAYETR